MTEFRNILVIGPSWLGDMVMAQCCLKLLLEENPQANITLLAPAWCLDIAKHMPEVTNTVTMPVGHGHLALGVRWKIARQLARESFDLAVVLPNSLKSALIPWFAGVSKRRGYVGEFRYGLLNDSRKSVKDHLALNIQQYAALAFVTPDDHYEVVLNPPKPSLQIKVAEQQATLAEFGVDADMPLLVLCPGAEFGPSKRWPETYFAEIADRMTEKGWQICLLGSKKDQIVTQTIVDQSCSALLDLAGQTTISQAVALLNAARAVVTNDSGLMHVAAAVDTPLVALFGSTSIHFTPPLSDKARILQTALDCRPCFKRDCPLGHHNCMKQLLPEQVVCELELIT